MLGAERRGSEVARLDLRVEENLAGDHDQCDRKDSAQREPQNGVGPVEVEVPGAPAVLDCPRRIEVDLIRGECCSDYAYDEGRVQRRGMPAGNQALGDLMPVGLEVNGRGDVHEQPAPQIAKEPL